MNTDIFYCLPLHVSEYYCWQRWRKKVGNPGVLTFRSPLATYIDRWASAFLSSLCNVWTQLFLQLLSNTRKKKFYNAMYVSRSPCSDFYFINAQDEGTKWLLQPLFLGWFTHAKKYKLVSAPLIYISTTISIREKKESIMCLFTCMNVSYKKFCILIRLSFLDVFY